MALFIGRKSYDTYIQLYDIIWHKTLANLWNKMLNRLKINFNVLVEKTKNSFHKSIKLAKFYVQTNLENTISKTYLLIPTKHFSEKLKEIKANEEIFHVKKRQFIIN